MDNREFVNTHHPRGTSPMLYAAREGHPTAIMSMVMCSGNPARQGSSWVDFFMAATSRRFKADMARTIHLLMSMQSDLPVGRGLRSMHDECVCCMQPFLGMQACGAEAPSLPLLLCMRLSRTQGNHCST